MRGQAVAAPDHSQLDVCSAGARVFKEVMGVDEVAAIAVHAVVVVLEVVALLGLVLHVDVVILEELVRTMCKFASFLIRAESVLHVPAAKL
jgi:hypothetical protein